MLLGSFPVKIKVTYHHVRLHCKTDIFPVDLIGKLNSSPQISLKSECLIDNCSQSYFTCFNGNYILQRCPDLFWFLRERETCVIQSDVSDCEFAPVTQPTQPTTTQPTTVTTPTTTTPATTTVSTPLPPLECPESGVSKLANPTSCTRHFMCFDGSLVERSCSPGLYFSRSRLQCVRRELSDCVLNNDSCPTVNDPDNIVFLADQEDCQRFA